MTSEQLQHARAERWRQSSNPLLTAEEAREWVESTGLCLFLPRRAQFAGAAPSFVEAVAGTVTDAPTREMVEQATALLRRLSADAAMVPLNLFGATGGFVTGAGAAAFGGVDMPDFLAAREVLPYVFSLVGGRNWKSGPGGKASPLMTEVWTLLEKEGALTAAEIQAALGRELTEAAVLRAVMELWHGLRAIPVYEEDVTRWELTQARFAAEMTASQKVAQTTALSTLVAMYLESAVAAGEEEIETFLSPLTSRSRVREVVNGLQATRQLGLVSVGAQPLLHVAGSLPEFAEEPEAEKPEGAERPERKAAGAEAERRPRFERREGTDRKPYERAAGGFARGKREGGGEGRPVRKSFERKPYERGERKSFGGRSQAGERKPFERGEKRPYSRPQDGERKSFERKPYERGERKPFERGEGFAARGGERPYRPKAEGERPYRKPEERRPYGDRPQSGDRKPFGKKPFERKPFERGEKRPYSRPQDGERKPYGARPSGGARPFDKERTGERRSFGAGGFAAKRPGAGGKFPPKRTGAGPARPWQERGGEREGERGAGREGGERKSFGGEKTFGARKPFGGPRKFGAGKPGGGRSFGRPAAGGFERGKPEGKRPFFRERPVKDGEGEPRRREFRSDSGSGEGARPAKREGGWKPKGAGFATGGKPGFKKPGFKSAGKPGFKTAGKTFGKPAFGKSGKPGFKSSGKPGFKKAGKPFGKPGFKKAGPGGSKPPFRKKKEGSGDGE